MSKFTPMAAGELKTLVASIGKAGAKLHGMIQKAAVNAVFQSIQHRNVTPMNDLYAATSKGIRRDSLVRFFEKYGNAAFVTADKTFKFFEVLRPDQFNGEVLMATPWDEAKAEKIDSIYDVAELVEKLIKKVEGSIEKTHQVKHGDLLDDIKLALQRYNSAQFEESEAGSE
jgi:hypothetical protein